MQSPADVQQDRTTATATAIRSALEDLRTYCSHPAFVSLVREFDELPIDKRTAFVSEVLLDQQELRSRNLPNVQGITIQRSAFRDGRPTMFCIVKHLPPGLLWHKVTITYDNPSGPPAIEYRDELHAPFLQGSAD